MFRKLLRQQKLIRIFVFAIVFAVIGIAALLVSRASSPSVSIEAEDPRNLIAGASLETGGDTSGSGFIQFENAASVKPAIKGVIDYYIRVYYAAQNPNPNYQQYAQTVNNYFINIPWKYLQPNGPDEIVADRIFVNGSARYEGSLAWALQTIKAASRPSKINADDLSQIKLRVTAGPDAPDWVKNLAGGPMNYTIPPNPPLPEEPPMTIPKFWTAEVKNAYDNLQRKLALSSDGGLGLDDNKYIGAVVIDRCMTGYPEPFLRGFVKKIDGEIVQQNFTNYIAAGFTSTPNFAEDVDFKCFKEQIDTHASVWKRTRSELAINPYFKAELSRLNCSVTDTSGCREVRCSFRVYSGDCNFTEQMIEYCRNPSKLGSRCVLSNYSIRYPALTGQDMTKMYDTIKQKGGPIGFQTARPPLIGDWRQTFEWAATQGANSVEVNAICVPIAPVACSGQPAYDITELRAVDSLLERNPAN